MTMTRAEYRESIVDLKSRAEYMQSDFTIEVMRNFLHLLNKRPEFSYSSNLVLPVSREEVENALQLFEKLNNLFITKAVNIAPEFARNPKQLQESFTIRDLGIIDRLDIFNSNANKFVNKLTAELQASAGPASAASSDTAPTNGSTGGTTWLLAPRRKTPPSESSSSSITSSDDDSHSRSPRSPRR